VARRTQIQSIERVSICNHPFFVSKHVRLHRCLLLACCGSWECALKCAGAKNNPFKAHLGGGQWTIGQQRNDVQMKYGMGRFRRKPNSVQAGLGFFDGRVDRAFYAELRDVTAFDRWCGEQYLVRWE